MERALLGIGRHVIPIPWRIVQWVLPRETRRTARVLGGLDDDHRQVHHFVVRELPRSGEPMSPDAIVEGLGMERSRVTEILDELERRLIFLFRPGGRDVVWAYPVTVEPTPHRLAFSSGERLWGA